MKALQSFNGHIKFIRVFIPNLAELMKPTQKLLKKDAKFEWNNEGLEAFICIKDAITRSPVLVIPDYYNGILIFSFAYESTVAEVLLQKNN